MKYAKYLMIVIFALVFGSFTMSNAEAVDIEDGGILDHSDKNATKVIKSDKIKSFKLIVQDDAVNDEYLSGRCKMELKKVSGGAEMSLIVDKHSNGGGNTHLSDTETMDASVLNELQAIVKEHNIASINGHNKWNSALGIYLDLEITYESGEKITAYGEGGDAVLPNNWNSHWFLDFFLKKLDFKNKMSDSYEADEDYDDDFDDDFDDDEDF